MARNNLGKRCFSLVLISLFAAGIALGEGAQERGDAEPLGETNGAASAPAGSFFVTDSFGREVEIPAEVERLSCLYSFTVHVVTMLGRGEDINAVVFGSKRDRLLNEINPHIADAAVPSDDGIINIEELVRIEPDIVFLKSDTAMMDSEIAKVERFNLPYVVIEYSTIAEQMEAIEIIGKVIGRTEEAEAYNRYYQEQIDFVSNRVKDIPMDDRVRVYHSVNEAARTDAPDTLPAEWTALTGAFNVSVGEPLRFYDNKYFASLEQIYVWDPDVIICNQEGVDEYMLTNEKWASLRAVKEKKVYQIPVGISRWGHPGGMETPLAMIWTAKTLYPDRFGDVDIRETMRYFYSEFFDHEISSEMEASILSGKGMRLPKGTIREQMK